MKIKSEAFYPLSIFLLLSCVMWLPGCGGKGGGTSSSSVQGVAQEASEQAQVISGNFHYIKIIENNEDKLDLKSNPEAAFSKIPFSIIDGALVVEKGAISSNLEIAQTTLFVEYQIVFNGSGRHGGKTKYYIFKEIPATIELEPSSIGTNTTEVEVTSDPSYLYEVRNVPKNIHISKVGNDFLADIEKNDGTHVSSKIETPQEGVSTQAAYIFVRNLNVKVLTPGTLPLVIAEGVDIASLLQPSTQTQPNVEFSTSLMLEDGGFFEKLTIH